MAKVMIIIEDSADGEGFKMRLKSEPPFANPLNKEAREELTPAQVIAAQLFSAIVEDNKENAVEEETQ